MKLVIYLTKNKIFFDRKAYSWTGNDLIKIFQGIRRDEKVRDVRIVLGNDISYLAAFKDEGNLSRDNIEMMTRGWMPFPLENKCFDYRVIVTEGGESWIQAIAVEKWLLESVSKAVWESGLSLELMIPVGVLIGEKTKGKKLPTIVKWTGPENLKVLAMNGSTDSVFTDEDDLQIFEYVKNRWSLQTNPEVMILDGKNFDLVQEAFKERNRGDDNAVLSIPVLKREEVFGGEGEKKIDEKVTIVEETKKESRVSKTTIFLIIILVLALGVMAFVLYNANKPTINPGLKSVPSAITPTAIPSVTVTPTAVVQQQIDFSKYAVQVLNGSGVTGEAGRIKDLLLAKGFVKVDTGNSAVTLDSLISRKADFPEQGMTIAKETVTGYKLGNNGLLTSSDKYDLVIVLGSNKI